MPAPEQPFCAAGGMERRIWLREGLKTSLEKLLRCCSVLLQSLLAEFVEIGCSNLSVLGQAYQCLVPLKGLWNLRPGEPLPSWQEWRGMAVALCDHDSWSFKKILM